MEVKMILSYREWMVMNAALRYMLMEEEDQRGSLEKVREYEELLQHMKDAYDVALEEEDEK